MDIVAFLFHGNQWWLWTIVLAVALFFPVRKLIWVLMVRRAARALSAQEKTISPEEINRLKRRATMTAVLLCFVIANLYVLATFRPIS